MNIRSACAALVLLLGSSSLFGQQFEIYRQFVSPTSGPTERMTVASDGNIYGTDWGGEFGRGEIFRLIPDGSGGFTFERLYSFHGPDGSTPVGVVQGSDGRFYGATETGGALGGGTVYAFDLATGLVVFHNFPVHFFYGFYNPFRLVEASDGNFYGTTAVGGAIGFGTIYRVTPAGVFTNLHDFTGPEGERPYGSLVQASDGYLYGTAGFGGTGTGPTGGPAGPTGPTGPTGLGYSGDGTLFRMDFSGNVTVLHSFVTAECAYAWGDLVEGPDGFLYGACVNGGSNNGGTAYRSDKSGNVTVLHEFPSTPDVGQYPTSGLALAGDGNFYGVTAFGGSGGGGTAYRMTAAGATDVVASFSSVAPSVAFYPYYGITPLGSGELLGLATQGGVDNRGVAFRIPASGTGFDVIHEFGALADLAKPASELVQTADGTIWGTAGGGSAGLGTVYRLSGGPLVAHEFSGADGANPGNLFAASDGSVYGVTASQGSGGSGTIFQLDGSGTFTTLHAFSGTDGADPEGGLMQASDGNFYGTTAFGGVNGGGTLFRLTSAGTYTKLHDFAADAVPEEPRGRILQASDGMLYFTTFGFRGTLYQSDLDGNLTDLHDFLGGDGEEPPAGVIQANDGNLYGTCRYWGGDIFGTVFGFALPSTYSVVHSFSNEGRSLGGVVQGSDGRLYGTTTGEQTSSPSHGGVFGVDLSGAGFAMIHEFAAYPDGDTPAAGLLRAGDGMLYGTTRAGGWSDLGLVFRVDLSGSLPSISDIAPASGTSQGGVALTILGEHLRPGIAGTVGGAAFEAADVLDHQTFFAVSPVLTPGTLNDVTVTNADGQSSTRAGAFFADFLDAPAGSRFHTEIETIFRAGITAGCGSGDYCTDAPASRAQMAVLLLKVEHGPAYQPPPCAGVFADVACPSLFADWIEQFAAEELSAGCGGGNYCPGSPVRRDQLAVLILKFEHGPAYVPPVCAGIFGDVPCPSPFADWIEQFAAEKITVGCGNGNYCPDGPTTRGQMAVFLTRALAFP